MLGHQTPTLSNCILKRKVKERRVQVVPALGRVQLDLQSAAQQLSLFGELWVPGRDLSSINKVNSSWGTSEIGLWPPHVCACIHSHIMNKHMCVCTYNTYRERDRMKEGEKEGEIFWRILSTPLFSKWPQLLRQGFQMFFMSFQILKSGKQIKSTCDKEGLRLKLNGS